MKQSLKKNLEKNQFFQPNTNFRENMVKNLMEEVSRYALVGGAIASKYDFAEGYIKLYGESGISLIERIYKGFEEEMTEHGIGTISELYNGDPPHRGKGAISQAWSIAELLRVSNMIE